MSAFLRKGKVHMTTVNLDETPTPTEQEKIASTIVIASYELEAQQARDAADLDEIQDVQDRYHEARMERAQRRINRRESESA
jgi:hypothetical protein